MAYIKTIFEFAGYISTGIVIVASFLAVVAWFKGVLPAVLRLGNGLAKRKIAIFAKASTSESLKNLLLDSGLFSEKNIISVTKGDDIGRAEPTTLFLVYWPDWKTDIDEILRKKNDGTALVVYAPQNLGRVPDEDARKINEHRNSILTNFRGRLLNDIVSSMITTSYKK